MRKIFVIGLVLALLLAPMVSAWSLGGWFSDFFRGAGTPVAQKIDDIPDKVVVKEVPVQAEVIEPQGIGVAKPLTPEEVEQWHPDVYVQTSEDGWAYEVWVNGELYLKKRIHIAPSELKEQVKSLYHEPLVIEGEPVVWAE